MQAHQSTRVLKYTLGKLKDDQTVTKTKVATGQSTTTQVAITQGLAVGDKVITSFDRGKAGAEAAAKTKAFTEEATAAIRAAGYPASADKAKVNTPVVILILTILLMPNGIYGTLAARLRSNRAA